MIRRIANTMWDMTLYSTVLAMTLGMIACAGPSRVILEPVMCTTWTEEAVEELAELMKQELAGEVKIKALKVEIKKRNRVCEANRTLGAEYESPSIWSFLPFVD